MFQELRVFDGNTACELPVPYLMPPLLVALNLLLLMAEILQAPVEVGSLNPNIYRVSYIPGGCLGFQPSTVGGSFKYV